MVDSLSSHATTNRGYRRAITVAAAIVVGVLTVAACASGSSGSGGKNLTRVTLVIPSNSVIAFYPEYVARQQGYFKDEGLDVTINSVNGTDPTTQALASGQANIVELSTSSLLPPGSQRSDFHPILFYLSYAGSPFDVLVPSNSPVTGPANLKGKTVGVGTPNGAEKIFAEALLGKQGLKVDQDYKTLVVGDGGQAIAAFQRGDIAAYASGLADVAVIKARGLDMRSIVPASFHSQSGFGFWTSQSYEKANGKTLEAFARALTKATTYVGKDAEKIVSVATKLSPEQTKDHSVATALADLAISLRQRDAGVTTGQVVASQWQGWYAGLVAVGQIKEGDKKDPSQFFTNDYAGK